MGRADFQSAAPCLRYETSTDAFLFSSPSTNHSNPRLMRVGGSTMNSPAVTASLGDAAATVQYFSVAPVTTIAVAATARPSQVRVLAMIMSFDDRVSEAIRNPESRHPRCGNGGDAAVLLSRRQRHRIRRRVVGHVENLCAQPKPLLRTQAEFPGETQVEVLPHGPLLRHVVDSQGQSSGVRQIVGGRPRSE